MKFVYVFVILAALVASSEAFFRAKPAPAKQVTSKKTTARTTPSRSRSAPAASAPKKASPAAVRKASKFAAKPAAPGVSKQRPFRFGGRTKGPEIFDDGLTELERKYISEGKSNALTGGAKLRFFFTKGNGF